MRVLHVITGLGVGGAETVLYRLIRGSAGRGVSHDVVSLGSDSALRDRFEAVADSVADVPWRPDHRLYRGISRLRRRVVELEPDIVAGWMYHGNLAAAVGVWRRNIPLVWNIRQSLYDIRDEKPLTQGIIRLGRRLSDRPAAIVYNSQASAAHHQQFGYSSRHSVVIPNGFDTCAFKPSSTARGKIRGELGLADSDIVISYVARFHPVKDHDTLLDSVAGLLRQDSRIRLILVGTGITADNAGLLDKLRTLGILGQTKLCGPREDIAGIYAASDVAVSASRAESFPNSVAEAMACGLTCVATDVGDVRAIVGEDGIVVPSQNPAALSAALARAVSLDVSERKAIGERARERIQSRYSLAGMVSKFVHCFSSSLGKAELCAE